MSSTHNAAPSAFTSLIPLPPLPSSGFYDPSSLLNPLHFTTTTTFLALSVPIARTGHLVLSLRQYLLSRPKTKTVFPHPDDADRRILVLSTDISTDGSAAAPSSYSSHLLPQEVHDIILKDSSSSSSPVILTSYPIASSYSDLTVDQVLRRLIPPTVTPDIPSSFEGAGHIAHVNLRDEVLPFKYVIGCVILSKNSPRIRTVVNKIGNVETEFRTFPMELIAGVQDMEVELREEGVRFKLDFAKVYWNSRLQYEHRRLVDFIAGKEHGGANRKSAPPSSGGGKSPSVLSSSSTSKSLVVADIMAGIGPFAIPLACQHNITVYANDLNPVSHKYLVSNVILNKCAPGKVKEYCMDGRAFVHHLAERDRNYDHAIMNLPAIAPEFLDAFRGWTPPPTTTDESAGGGGTGRYPMLHVYCFVKAESVLEGESQALDRCSRALGVTIEMERDEVSVHNVRDIAPKKIMLCVSFRLPAEVKNVEKISIGATKGSKQYIDLV